MYFTSLFILHTITMCLFLLHNFRHYPHEGLLQIFSKLSSMEQRYCHTPYFNGEEYNYTYSMLINFVLFVLKEK